MKYLIVGTGGTGGALGGFLAKSGQEVTFIARGEHLQALQTKGLTIHSGLQGEMHLPHIKAVTAEEYEQSKEIPDVIFVAVKGYSLDSILPLLAKCATKDTVVIPILNIYGTGEYLAKHLPNTNVLSGCIYIVAYISAPGEITQSLKIFRVVFGTDGPSPLSPKLEAIKTELEAAGIKVTLSEHIKDDTFRKFTFISPYASVGAYFDIPAGDMQKPGEAQDLFIKLINDCVTLAKAYDINVPENIVELNLKTLNGMGPGDTASMQKDLAAHKQSELDGIVYEVLRMAKAKNLNLPGYEQVAEGLKKYL